MLQGLCSGQSHRFSRLITIAVVSGRQSNTPTGAIPLEFRYDQTVIAVNLRDRDALMAAVAGRLAAGDGFALATINLDHLVKLAGSERFRRAYGAQDMVVADGNPIVWLSRLAARPVALVPGSDMVVPLARLAATAGVPIALVGSTQAALDGAAAALGERIAGVQIATRIAPPFGFDPEGHEAEAILADLAKTGVRLCFVALGAPKQEIFAALGRRVAPQIGFASVGAGLDFLADQQTRAPQWVRRMAMEWAWRMLSNPRRLIPRYAACAAILPGQAIAALRLRRQG